MKTTKNSLLNSGSGFTFMTILMVSILVCSSVTIFAQEKKTDFSGLWKLDESKSQIGEGRGRMAATKMKITQDATTLSNEKTSVRQSGEEVTTTEKVTFDGRETDNSASNRQKKSTASWSADGKILTISSTTIFERDGNTMEIKSVEIYKPGTDNTFTIESSSTSPRGESKATLVYNKVN
jgi:hypothetical protein